jgi:hypothetical protein
MKGEWYGCQSIEEGYNYYELLQDIPCLSRGSIFYWDKDDNIYGSIAEGCLKLCWTPKGSCYSGLAGDTIIFHASARKETEWFKLVQEYIKPEDIPIDLTQREIEAILGYKINIKS